MIVRNCAADLDACLKSSAPYVDDLVIVNTAVSEHEEGFAETNAVAERYGARIFHFPWTEDFSAARNFSFAQCKYNYVIWLDADDVIENPQAFFTIARNELSTGETDSIHAEYLYDFDSAGSCTTRLQRERVVDRRFMTWVEPIHEILHQKFHTRCKLIPPSEARVVHRRTRDEPAQKRSLERNLRVFEENFIHRGRPCGERMLFYWANTLLGMNRPQEALDKYKRYVTLSNNPVEIQQALVSAAECCRMMKDFRMAGAYAYQAIEVDPRTPSPYMILAQTKYEMGRKDLARHFAKMCVERAGNFALEMVANPKLVNGTAPLLVAQCAYEANDLEECSKYLDLGARIYGTNEPTILRMREWLDQQVIRNDVITAFRVARDALKAEGREDEIQKLAEAAPAVIGGHPEVLIHLPKIRDNSKPTLVIAAPSGMPNGWGPELLKTGIGGSEEAVCYMAPAMARRGWNVEVYAKTKRQKVDGVDWFPWEHYTGQKDNPDALVVWRFPEVVMLGSGAKTKWYWGHDMPNQAAWFPGSWNAFDGMFFLSEFHKQAYGYIPDEKKILSANGISHPDLVPLDDLANEPKRLIYASCPTRGLPILLHWWGYMREQVPDLELDVFYGLHPTLMSMLGPAEHGAAARRHLVQQVQEMKDQPGINWKGFVGQEELHKGFARAGVWAYPCTFPEISCITAMKIQAHGCVPVTSSNFALAETVTHGVKIDGEMYDPVVQKAWVDAVLEQVRNPWTKEQRLEMARAARARFNWETVADQWDGLMRAKLAEGKEPLVLQRESFSRLKEAMVG